MEYDLVIIGSSQAAIEAAEKATLLGARTALVTQCQEYSINHNYHHNFLSFKEVTRLIEGIKHSPYVLPTDLKNNLKINFNAVNIINSHIINTDNTFSKLAALGVDVIWGKGEFCRLPKQAFIVRERKLQSCCYLLAIDYNFKIPDISELELVNCLTYHDIWQQKDLRSLGNNIAVVGNSVSSLELAQLLGRLGKKVTLIVAASRILPKEELSVIMILQAQLEADGIEIITNSSITQIKKIGDETWLQAGDKALVIDTIIFAEERELNITELNLAGVGVKYNEAKIIVNNKLQTTNPSIYACGDSTGIFSLGMMQQQINTILKNILFFPWFQANYSFIPKVILTEPTLASVGIIETEARKDYGDKIYVVREYFKNIPQAKISHKTTGWCQFILNSQGVILGCTIIGDRAEELITTIAVIMRHKIKLGKNSTQALLNTKISTVTPSCSEILNKVALEFHQQKLQRHKTQNYWLKTWLKIKRNFSQ